MARRLSLLLALPLCLGVAACEGCNADPGTTALEPSAQVEGAPADPEGRASFLLDFGTVAVGTEAVRTLTLRNGGTAELNVVPPALAAPFSSDVPAAGATLAVEGRLPIEFAFRPTETGAQEAVVTLATDGGEITVRLAGSGAVPAFACTPAELDFGRVVRATSRSLDVTCTNDGEVDGALVVSAIQGDDREQFSTGLAAQDGRVLVPAGGSLTIPVTFRAQRPGDAFAFFTVDDGEGTSVQRVILRAVTLESALEIVPDGSCLDFGFVAPGATARRSILLRNLGAEPLEITAVSVAPGSDPDFSVADGGTAVLPADDPATPEAEHEREVFVDFTPQVEGSREATVVVESADASSPRVTVCATGFGGGPVLSCAPAALDFGQVARGIPATRTFVCSNAGNDAAGTDLDNLIVESVTSTGPEFVPVVRGGIAPRGYAAGELFTVDVAYDPADEGLDSAAIVLRTNSTSGAETRIPVAAHGRDLPPCQLEARPETLRFGIVDRGASATLELALVNQLATECLVSNLDLSPDSHPAFSLPEGPIAFRSLGDQEDLRIPVTFAPEAFGERFEGAVTFTVSNPAQPTITIPLVGSSQEPCAIIVPDDLDFGTVQPGCSTRDRELQIVNVCQTPLVITAVELNDNPTDEFLVRARPPLPSTIAAGAAVTFTMAYRAEDQGVDVGSVFISVEGQTEPYMATMRGGGANDATQTDSFVQEDRPQVDLLWVIDNSGSLSEEQANIAANLDSFLDFAISQQIDFQIGVTTTGVTSGGGCPGGADGNEDGRLFPVDGSHPRILTPSTPDLAEHWAHNTSVGTCHFDEQGLEAAYRALTSPVIDSADDPRHPEPNDGNLGFLRRDAHLSMIFVSDEEDASDQTTNFYFAAFQQLKGARNDHLLSIHAIVGDPNTGCNGAGGNASAGDRYFDMVSRTNGVFQSICQADWAQALEDIGVGAFGFKTCFFLGNQPEDTDGNGVISEGELEVRLDGRATPSTGNQGNRQWEYRADTNAVCFYPLAVPEPGTQIDVSYRVACL